MNKINLILLPFVVIFVFSLVYDLSIRMSTNKAIQEVEAQTCEMLPTIRTVNCTNQAFGQETALCYTLTPPKVVVGFTGVKNADNGWYVNSATCCELAIN